MIKNDFFNTLDFMTLPPHGGVIAPDLDFALYDNINYAMEQSLDLSSDPVTLSIISSSCPYKITFTLVIACLDGTMSARLNLVDYELKKNDMLIVTPGMIGECVEFSCPELQDFDFGSRYGRFPRRLCLYEEKDFRRRLHAGALLQCGADNPVSTPAG